jgi:hypothetical protein
MLYIDYEWHLEKDGINLDNELNTSVLGWKDGDLFKLVTIRGRRRLVKLDELEQFVRGSSKNGQSS